jgi:CheY-like chemotaxis protein
MKLRELRILHIDDDEIFSLGFQTLLKAEGARVFGLENLDKPNAALDLIRKHDINFILLDINFAGHNSFHFSKLIRKEIADPDLPILFLTSIKDRNIAQEAFDSGATDVLTKDFSGSEINARIDSHHKAHFSRKLKSNVANLTLVLELTGQLLHELNNPLQVLSGQVFKLKSGNEESRKESEKMEASLQKIERTIKQLSEIREKTLTLTKTKPEYQNYHSIPNLLLNYGLLKISVEDIQDKNILFVDDELEILYAMKDLLKETWIGNIELATSVEEGLTVCREEKIDLVVTDLKMPDMDGFDFIKILNNEELVPQIIVMTAYWNKMIIEDLKKYEIAEVLRKPISFEDFLAVLKKIDWT